MALQTKTVQTGDYAWKSWSNGYVISLKLTEESTDIAANTSRVSYLFTISNTNNNRFVDNNNTWTISIGGQEISIGNFNFNLGENYTTQTIASGQVTVAHNPDGKKQMSYSVSVPNIQSWNRYGPPAMSLSGTWELTAIPRASTLSCPVGVIGKPVTVTIQKADESYRHTVTYAFGNTQGVIAELTDLTKITWTIPTGFYGQIPNARRGEGKLFCKTYSGTTLVGEASCLFYADVDEQACRPEITARVEDSNPVTLSLTGNPNILIRYYSDAFVTAEYTAKNSAAITDYGLQYGGKVYKETTLTIPGTESGEFAFSATDSRGLTAAARIEKPLIPYVKLTCNLANNKPDGEGNMTISVSGNFFADTFGAQENTLSVQYRYKLSGAPWLDTQEEWRELTPELAGNGYTANTVLTGLDYQMAYTVQTRAVDRLATAYSVEHTVRATPVFDWSEQDFQFHVPVRGITADMVGARYSAVDGALLLKETGVESGLLFATDRGNPSNYYFGLFYGYRKDQTAATLHTLCANTLTIATNTFGTVAANNAVGEVTYVVIPFTHL